MNGWLVQEGWALNYAEHSGGLGEADPPVLRPLAAAPGDSCVIKGNINWEDEHIYHLPGWPSYDDTMINEANGERWF